MQRKKLSSLVFLGGMLFACLPPSDPIDDQEPAGPSAIDRTDACVLPEIPSGPGIAYQLDLPYDAPNGAPITLDLVWPTAPAAPASRPLIVLVHGGAWREGTPRQFTVEALRLAGQGYVVASVGYRLVPSVRFPVPIGDVSCAIRFLRLASIELGGDTSQVMLIGHSAGAHIAALAGLRPEAEFDTACPYRGLAGNRATGVIALSGAFDLTRSDDFSPTTRGEITNLLGGPAESRPELARSASPVFHISQGDPPTLLIHGTTDDVTPLRQSQQLFAALRAGGVPSTLLELKGVWHDITPLDTALSRRASSCTVWAFIRKRLGTPAF